MTWLMASFPDKIYDGPFLSMEEPDYPAFVCSLNATFSSQVEILAPAFQVRPISKLSIISFILALRAIKWGWCLPAVFCTLPSAEWSPAAGQFQPRGQQLPTPPGHEGHQERHPLVSVAVTRVAYCI